MDALGEILSVFYSSKVLLVWELRIPVIKIQGPYVIIVLDFFFFFWYCVVCLFLFFSFCPFGFSLLFSVIFIFSKQWVGFILKKQYLFSSFLF